MYAGNFSGREQIASWNDEAGMFSSKGDLEGLILPTYKSISAAAPPTPIVRLATFEDLRANITRARQLIFGHKKGSFRANSRVTLSGDEKNLDFLLAGFMNRRDVSGDFGTRSDATPPVAPDFFQVDEIVDVKREAARKLVQINDRFKMVVAAPLEQQLEGGGLFKSTKKVNYNDLATRAGPILREATQVHENMEEVIQQALARWWTQQGEQLPAYAAAGP